MKISILSQLGESGDLAYRLQEEGHDVTFNILTKEEGEVGKGFLNVKANHTPDLTADLIINDDVFLGQVSDTLRNAGKVVLGGSEITDRLENDRTFGADIMRACGIKVPKSQTFSSFSGATAFLKKNPGKYVFKPHGQEDRFFTHIARDTEDMLAMLEYYQSIWPNGLTFELQEFVVGIEMAIGAWFNGTKFCKPVLPNFEFKKLMNGDIGPNTGEMGSVMAYRTHSKLFQETLAKSEAFLKTTGYRGFIDIACVVTRDAAYGLEWTARFGFPTIQIQDEVHYKGTWADFLYKLAQGLTDEVPADTSKWDVGVAICALPWPQKSIDARFTDVPVFFPEDMSHIHLRDVRLDGQYKQAGMMGYICICTGSEVTIEKAKNKAYKVVDMVHVPGGFYRTDIGDRVIENMSILREMGWIR
jgi:phosphoribosylamine---glycine ligase